MGFAKYNVNVKGVINNIVIKFINVSGILDFYLLTLATRAKGNLHLLTSSTYFHSFHTTKLASSGGSFLRWEYSRETETPPMWPTEP